MVKYSLGFFGHEVVGEDYGVTPDGARFFGVLSLRSEYGDYTDTVGLRNSHDKRFPIGISFGSRVFVCDMLPRQPLRFLLAARLDKRMDEIKRERQISPLPPVVLGGVLIVPVGLVTQMTGQTEFHPTSPIDTQIAAARARAIIMDVERSLGFVPVDREFDKLGYDIESAIPNTGRLRFIEVKGRVSGAPTITVTRNEILYSLNKPEDFILGIVEFMPDGGHRVHYVREPFKREPDFAAASVNYEFTELLAMASAPS